MKRTEHTQKWLDVLRSGEYKQGYGQMEHHGCYCALGVAREIVFKEPVFFHELVNEIGASIQEADDIICMNDTLKKPFPEIADAIEQMLDGN